MRKLSLVGENGSSATISSAQSAARVRHDPKVCFYFCSVEATALIFSDPTDNVLYFSLNFEQDKNIFSMCL